MASLEELQQEIEHIKLRNMKVESAKAWEKSWTRKLIIMILTYLVVGLYADAIHAQRPWLGAFVPAGAFLASTFTLPVFKELWIRDVFKKGKHADRATR